ncbi:MAG TPA: transglutaminase family protein, partial [Thermoanaerobaculia bacterium]|nr:transglutaminase family protein [Thermoanaerobaculia bacterium]
MEREPTPQERILARIASGADARQAWSELGTAASGPGVLPPRSDLASQFADELAAVRASARTAAHSAGDPLAAALDGLAAEDLLVEAHFTDIEARLAALPASDALRERLVVAQARYRAHRDALFAPVGGVVAWRERQPDAEPPAAARSALAAKLVEDKGPIVPTLRSHLLPFGPASLAPRAPVTTPVVVPSYVGPASPVVAADLAAAPLSPLSQPIVQQAAALGYDVVKVFEFVRNQVRTEWYAGAMKGAETTLLQRAGNDVDQATLLVALLRASRTPARFVRGVVELPLEAVAGDLGLRDTSRVPAALRAAGVAYTPVIRGGRVAAVQVEHTWVSAYVPYTNYRGVVVDRSGETWLPLAPALKSSTWVQPTGVLRLMHYDSTAGVAAYLAAPQAVEPLAVLRQQIEHYLATQGGLGYEAQLAKQTIVASELGMLPSTLPADVVAVTGESAQLPSSSIQRLRIVARAGTAETDAAILDVTLPVADLAGRRVTFSYLPATIDDQNAVNSWGGLDAVPAYLVRLRPQLKVAGRSVAVAPGSLEMGRPHRLELRLLAPGGDDAVSQTVIAGAYHAIGVSAQLAVAGADDAGLADTEQQAASLLAGLAVTYARRCGAAEEELASLADVVVVRPQPALALVTDAVALETLFDLPYRLAWQGVTLDSALRVAEPVDRGAGAGAADWTRLAGLEASALERFVFEDQLQVHGVSADSGLGAARAAGQTVYSIDGANSAQLLPQLAHPAAVVAEIAE